MEIVAAVFLLLCLGWIVSRLWKDHALVAIASIFFWPVLFYPLAIHWGDRERDIRTPFLVFLAALLAYVPFL